MGGLGNQLFQYAFGRSIEEECGATVFFDSSSVSQKNGRQYMLDRFNTKVRMVSETARHTLRERFLQMFIEERKIRENDMAYTPSLLARIKKGGSFYLEGYWQTEKYFTNIREELLNEITLRRPLSEMAERIERDIISSASVGIHVRRGDYVTNQGAAGVHGTCGPLYYGAAIASITGKLPNPHFFVFSDDIAWVKENLPLDPAMATYVSGAGISDEEELMLMSRCQHTIIANSSFSWWGAWLNRNEKKIVIAPKEWFRDPSKNAPDLIPPSWIQI